MSHCLFRGPSHSNNNSTSFGWDAACHFHLLLIYPHTTWYTTHNSIVVWKYNLIAHSPIIHHPLARHPHSLIPPTVNNNFHRIVTLSHQTTRRHTTTSVLWIATGRGAIRRTKWNENGCVGNYCWRNPRVGAHYFFDSGSCYSSSPFPPTHRILISNNLSQYIVRMLVEYSWYHNPISLLL